MQDVIQPTAPSPLSTLPSSHVEGFVPQATRKATLHTFPTPNASIPSTRKGQPHARPSQPQPNSLRPDASVQAPKMHQSPYLRVCLDPVRDPGHRILRQHLTLKQCLKGGGAGRGEGNRNQGLGFGFRGFIRTFSGYHLIKAGRHAGRLARGRADTRAACSARWRASAKAGRR